MCGLVEQVNNIYARKQSPEVSAKFYNDHSTIYYSLVQLPFGGTWVGAQDAEWILDSRGEAS